MKEFNAEDALRSQLGFIKKYGGGPKAIDAAIAKNIIDDELGLYEREYPQAVYHLDEATRDRLVVHARQDAAHAVLIAIRSQHDLATIKRLVIWVAIFCAVIILKLDGLLPFSWQSIVDLLPAAWK